MAAWSEFWSHNPPHTAYVVGAYAASAVGTAGIVIDSLLRARRWKAQAQMRNPPR